MTKNTEAIINSIHSFLQKNKLLEPETTLLVAFSGGPDSLCLLDAINSINNKYAFHLAAAHLNHNWRGEESEKEAKLAEKYCRGKNIDFYTETLPPNIPKTEETARNKRYEFLNKIAGEIKATAIITGHTLTDQAETILYRIIKGAGISGLGGIPEIRKQKGQPAIYRPLLANIYRLDCIQYCKENSLEASFDPSNYDEKYLRNRIRHNLMPELRSYNRSVDDAILRLGVIARDTEKIIEEYYAEVRKNIFKNNQTINTKEFLKLSEPLKKRVLADYLSKNNIEHPFERINNIFSFIHKNSASKSGNTYSVSKNKWVFVSLKEIKIIKKTKAKHIESVINVLLDGETSHPELNVTLSVQKWLGKKPDKFPAENENFIYADLSEAGEDLHIRTRRPGDVIQPFGMKEKTKLKKYFINKGIPKYMRDEIPLIVNKNQVLWAIGVGMSELLRVKNIPQKILEVKDQ